MTSFTCSGVPTGGTLSVGEGSSIIDNEDGTWTVNASDIDDLTITAPADSGVDMTSITVVANVTHLLTGDVTATEHPPAYKYIGTRPIRHDGYDKVIGNIEEVRARKGEIIAIATEGDTEIAKYSDSVIYVPDCLVPLSPLLTVVPLQLIAYHAAVARGCNVDKPRNLAKSVTVE